MKTWEFNSYGDIVSCDASTVKEVIAYLKEIKFFKYAEVKHIKQIK